MIGSIIAKFIEPAHKIIDELHTSGEEKQDFELKKTKAKQNILELMMKFESAVVDAQAGIIRAEIQGGRLARNWRPILMLSFGLVILLDCVGLSSDAFSEKKAEYVYAIIQVGVGGYVVGRSSEKIFKEWKGGKA